MDMHYSTYASLESGKYSGPEHRFHALLLVLRASRNLRLIYVHRRHSLLKSSQNQRRDTKQNFGRVVCRSNLARSTTPVTKSETSAV